MYEDLKCTCGAELEYDDMTDDTTDGEIYYQDWAGRCSECGKKYTWTEVYRFSHISDLKERE